jgi:hypothetical protein
MAGLKVILQTRQTDFPEELYPVYMIAIVAANDGEGMALEGTLAMNT